MTSVYAFSAVAIDGETIDFSDYQGKVLLIVNVASECGFTPQYKGLQTLFETYRDQGLLVLGFPCNQFGRQEPGEPAQIAGFCTQQYGVTFPLFEKIDVNGPGAHPLYTWLKTRKSGVLGSQSIKWNFTKFLLGRDGEVLQRYGSTTKPEAMRRDIEKALEHS
ncbi:glutathione peroxidase [Pusillimonas sp. MFBS29]|uniref:glutathione peroxidase n=1 Tax=Pusillimonas sp. MFBS29 TaxID=2886690 RepID=UPI001D115345|nr:glutathione peroxidase [Pusillimonas sp. MFBS29]MCC2595555.1 glutathione peroxidase [Pusillimonas sp. MFBS29]